jgi:hypothetical protein
MLFDSLDGMKFLKLFFGKHLMQIFLKMQNIGVCFSIPMDVPSNLSGTYPIPGQSQLGRQVLFEDIELSEWQSEEVHYQEVRLIIGSTSKVDSNLIYKVKRHMDNHSSFKGERVEIIELRGRFRRVFKEEGNRNHVFHYQGDFENKWIKGNCNIFHDGYYLLR